MTDEVKHLSQVPEVCEALGITRASLQKLFPYIPHVLITSTRTRLFPTNYVLALAYRLNEAELRPTQGNVREYAATGEAHLIAVQALAHLSSMIGGNPLLPIAKAAAALCVDRDTIKRLCTAGVLNEIREEIIPQRDMGRPRAGRIFVVRAELWAAIEWVTPYRSQ